MTAGQDQGLALPGVAPRVLQQHQRQQAARLRLARHQGNQDATQPDGLKK
jgi:hypothetical protein